MKFVGVTSFIVCNCQWNKLGLGKGRFGMCPHHNILILIAMLQTHILIAYYIFLYSELKTQHRCVIWRLVFGELMREYFWLGFQVLIEMKKKYHLPRYLLKKPKPLRGVWFVDCHMPLQNKILKNLILGNMIHRNMKTPYLFCRKVSSKFDKYLINLLHA